MRGFRNARAAVALGVLALGAPAVWAQAHGVITYVPAAVGGGRTVSAVPTLGEWGLLVLALLVVVVAWRALRARVGAHLLTPLLLVGGLLLASGFHGAAWMPAAQAVPGDGDDPFELGLSEPIGGQAQIKVGGVTRVTNTSGVALTITKLEAVDDDPDDYGYPVFWDPTDLTEWVPGVGPGDACTVGKTLSPDGVCWVVLTVAA